MNPWKILGVHRKSSDEEIQKAFKSLCTQHHPDAGGNTQDFQLIKAAYDNIKNSKARNNFITKYLYKNKNCSFCEGAGVKYKSKGFTEKIYTPCTSCGGSGFIIKEEEDSDVVKL